MDCRCASIMMMMTTTTMMIITTKIFKVLVWKELHYGRMNTKERRMMITEVNILREVEHQVRRRRCE